MHLQSCEGSVRGGGGSRGGGGGWDEDHFTL